MFKQNTQTQKENSKPKYKQKNICLYIAVYILLIQKTKFDAHFYFLPFVKCLRKKNKPGKSKQFQILWIHQQQGLYILKNEHYFVLS